MPWILSLQFLQLLCNQQNAARFAAQPSSALPCALWAAPRWSAFGGGCWALHTIVQPS